MSERASRVPARTATCTDRQRPARTPIPQQEKSPGCATLLIQHQLSSRSRALEVDGAAKRHRGTRAHRACGSPTRIACYVTTAVVVKSNSLVLKFFFFYAEHSLCETHSVSKGVSRDVPSALAAQRSRIELRTRRPFPTSGRRRSRWCPPRRPRTDRRPSNTAKSTTPTVEAHGQGNVWYSSKVPRTDSGHGRLPL